MRWVIAMVIGPSKKWRFCWSPQRGRRITAVFDTPGPDTHCVIPLGED